MREFRKGYNQSHKVRSPEVRSPEVRSPEVRSPEVRSPKVRSPEVRSLEVRSPEIRSTKINRWNMFEDFSTNTRNELATAHGQDPENGKFQLFYMPIISLEFALICLHSSIAYIIDESD